MKKRVLSLVLALALCLTLFPAPVWAAEGDAPTAEADSTAVAEVTIGGTATYYDDIGEAFDAAAAASSATIKLLADVVEINKVNGEGVELRSGDTTLDLNGKTLRQAAKAEWAGSGITVSVSSSSYSGTDGKLTICDSVGGGKIQQINTIPAVSASGNATLIIESGIIEAPDSGEWPDSGQNMYLNSAVNIDDKATVIINGGTLSGVRGVLEDLSDGGGSLTITGGTFIGSSGNALIVCNGEATLSGGTFSNDSSQNEHSIWVEAGKAADLLAENYQYIAGDDTASQYSADGKGVVGSTSVKNPNDKSVSYIKADGTLGTQAVYTEFTDETDDISQAATQGWYVLKEDVTLSQLNVSEVVNLILCDGATLTVSQYLNVGQYSTLNLYWQSGGSGKLTAKTVSQESHINAPAGEMKQTTGEGGTTYEKCLNHEERYTDNEDGTHTLTCPLCGKNGGTEAHSFGGWTAADEKNHTGTCVCGAQSTVEHTFAYHLSTDRKSHYGVCGVCEYTSAEALHDADGENGSCSVCGADADVAVEKVEVVKTNYDGTVTTARYADLIEAFKDADDSQAKEIEVNLLQPGKTYTLNTTEAFPIKFRYTNQVNVIVDLNGCTLKRSADEDEYGILRVVKGTVTFQNGTLDLDNSKPYSPEPAIRIEGNNSSNPATLTLKNMTVKATRDYAIIAQADGTLNIESGNYGEIVINDNFAAAKLSGGVYASILCYNNGYAKLLETGYIFAKQSDNSYIDPSTMSSEAGKDQNIQNIKVIPCTHEAEFVDGECPRCGYVCEHKDASGAFTIDNDGKCTVCKTQMVARDNTGRFYEALSDAIEAVADNGSVTLLADVDDDLLVFCHDAEGELVDKTVTLHMNGKRLSWPYENYRTPVIEVLCGHLIIADDAAVSLDSPGSTFAVSVQGETEGSGTLELQGKASIHGGLELYEYGTLAGGLKVGSIITKNDNYSVSVADSSVYDSVIELLPEGYAFAQYNSDGTTGDVVPAGGTQLTQDVIVVEHTHWFDPAGMCRCGRACAHPSDQVDFETGVCGVCKKKMGAAVTTSGGSTEYCNENEIMNTVSIAPAGSTVKLYMDTPAGVRLYPNNSITLDANNHSIGDLLLNFTSVTVKNATLINNLAVKQSNTAAVLENCAVQVKQGKVITIDGPLTMKGGSLQGYIISMDHNGKLTLEGNVTLRGSLMLSGNSQLQTKLTQGTFLLNSDLQPYSISVESSSKYTNVCELLAEGYAFAEYDSADESTDEIVNGHVSKLTQDVAIVEHPQHTFRKRDGNYVCVCGEQHETHVLDARGHCTLCDYVCPHTDVTGSGDDYTCDTCHAKMTVRLTHSDKTEEYFSSDTLAEALDRWLADGDTVTLLTDELKPSNVYWTAPDGTTTTLDLNGHTLDGTGRQIAIENGSTLCIVGSGSYTGALTNHSGDSVLDLSGWTSGTINRIRRENKRSKLIPSKHSDTKIGTLLLWISEEYLRELDGGTYDKIIPNDSYYNTTAGALLLSGYAFKHTGENGSYVPYSTSITAESPLENVTVVQCPHEEIHSGACTYCGRTDIAAVVTTADGKATFYDSFTTALAALEKSNGTLRLTADADLSEITTLTTTLAGTTDAVIDLNGYSITGGALTLIATKVTIQNSSTDKSGALDSVVANSGTDLTVEGAALGTLTVANGVNTAITLKEGTSFKTCDLTNSGLVMADLVQPGYYFDSDVVLTSYSIRSTDSYTVHKISGTVTATDRSGSIPYDGAVADALYPTVAASDAEYLRYEWYYRTGSSLTKLATAVPDGQGGYTWDQESGAFSGLKAKDTLNVFCIITAADEDNNELWKTPVTGYTLTITQGQAAVTQKPAAQRDLTYSGSAQELITAGDAAGGTMQYSLDGTHYTAELPTATQAGNYTVWYKAAGDENHKDTEPDSISVTIAPKRVTDPVIEIAPGSVYDGTEQKPQVTVKDADTVIDAQEYTLAYADNISAGTATVTITDKDGGNYILSDAAQKFTIAKAQAPTPKTGSVTIYNNRYYIYHFDLSTLLPTLDAEQSYGQITYTAKTWNLITSLSYAVVPVFAGNQLRLDVSAPDVDNTGEIAAATITVTSDNYADFDLTVYAVAANRLLLTGAPTLSSDTITYGDAVNTITLSGALKYNGKDVTGKFEWKDGSVTPDAGTYDAEWKFTPDDSIYAESSGKSTITVRNAQLTGVSVAQSGTLTYNGQMQTADVTTDATAVNGQQVTFTYCDTQDGVYGAMPQFRDAGAHTVYFKASADNHTDVRGQFTVTIGQADPTCSAPTDVTAIYGQALRDIGLNNPAGNTPGTWTWTDGSQLVGDVGTRSFTANFTPEDATNYRGKAGIAVSVTVGKADAAVSKAPTAKQLTYTGAPQALVEGGATADGTMTYSLSRDGAYAADIPTGTQAGAYTVWYKVAGDGNHKDTEPDSVSVTIDRQQVTVPAADTTAFTYNGAEQTYAIAANDNYTVAGNVRKDAGEQTVTVTLNDTENYVWSDGTDEAKTFAFVIAKATVTITVQNKSAYTGSAAPDLSKAEPEQDYVVSGLIGDDTLTTPPTLKYVNEAGEEITPDMKTTGEVLIGADGAQSGNYDIRYVFGKLTISNRPSSGPSTVKTETTKNPDGSTTKTETKSDGTVIETTTNTDGSVTKTETKKDGSTKTETKDPNGSTGTVSTDKNGQTEAKASISEKAVSEAEKNGEAVKVPTEVTPGTDSASAPTVKIDLPSSAGETEVEIPVRDMTPGTVAVIVKPDGTEEIIKDSVPTENGIRLRVEGDVTVKIVDNAKGFTDIRGHWAEDSINFVSARGLVNGMSATIFAPNAPTTRAQLWTILARQADADLTGGSVWYEKAQTWVKANGISDGSDPNGVITRAQMVTMLWRTAGSPEVTGAVTFTDVPAGSYYAKAVAWAVQNGITTGVGGGRFDPNGICTRAQIAAFLHRLYLSR